MPDEELRQSVKKIVSAASTEFSVYKAKFVNHLGVHTIRFGGWGNVTRERLFRRDAAVYSDDKVHEFLVTDRKSGMMEGKLNHYTYKSIYHHVSKINTYSDMMAEKMFERGKKYRNFKIIMSPVFEFIKVYIFKLGFLDGFAGFYVAKTMSYYTFLKYMKLREKIRLIEIGQKFY